MRFFSLIRWLGLFFYLGSFIAFPLVILWGYTGLTFGFFLLTLILATLFYRGTNRLLNVLEATPISYNENPVLHSLNEEYARRLAIPAPKLYLLKSDSPNLAVLGFSRNRSHLLITRGLLQYLSRTELSSVMARALSEIWFRDMSSSEWLGLLLDGVEHLMWHFRLYPIQRNLRQYPLRLLFWQLVFIPLLLPIRYFLLGYIPIKYSNEKIDDLSIRLSHLPMELSEAYKKMESSKDRYPLKLPLSVRHFFLLEPQLRDPIASAFFVPSSLLDRIHRLNTQSRLIHR